MENLLQTDVLIMDFSKAFDKVSHNLLTHKLNYYGIQGNTNTWMHNFLSNRTQAVLLEGETSNSKSCVSHDLFFFRKVMIALTTTCSMILQHMQLQVI
jgi:hypothetical protein